jgi:hydroxypyruvate reductase
VRAAIRASEPGRLLASALQHHPLSDSPVNVIAAGKAAPSMADAFLRAHGRVHDVVIADGAHPVPDERSVESGRRALALAQAARARSEPVVLLLSGGASAMLAVPPAGLSLADKATATRTLLASGLPISAMNGVRKHLSAIKGGWLAAQAGRIVTFALSDVHAPVEDDPSVIGSGPAVADPSTFGDAVAAVRAAGLDRTLPAAVVRWLTDGAAGAHPETPKPGDPRLANAEVVVIGNRRTLLDAAAAASRDRGYRVERIADPIVGETAEAARRFLAHAPAGERPVALLGGGETTVTLPSGGRTGRGGRNQEFALAIAGGLPAHAPCVFVSAGTDGIDGPTDAAGAFADETTVGRAAAAGLDAAGALRAHASYDFFARLDDLLVTGPTGTNLGDLQVLLMR